MPHNICERYWIWSCVLERRLHCSICLILWSCRCKLIIYYMAMIGLWVFSILYHFTDAHCIDEMLYHHANTFRCGCGNVQNAVCLMKYVTITGTVWMHIVWASRAVTAVIDASVKTGTSETTVHTVMMNLYQLVISNSFLLYIYCTCVLDIQCMLYDRSCMCRQAAICAVLVRKYLLWQHVP